MGTGHLEDLCIGGRYKSVFSKSRMWWHGLDSRGSPGYGQVAGTCECGYEPSGSIKRGEFLDQLRIC